MAGLLLTILLYSCANIGRPGGGPRDQDPPIFVGSDPAANALNVKKNKIELIFDEIVTLKDQQTKVVISPVQKEMPSISSNGRKVTVEFRDSMIPNTTYSIDFSNSIQDNNEGNPLEDFAIAFSTGDTIDSLEVSGIVLRARDLEPMQSIIVGIHSNLEDSAFRTLKFDRIARTNSYGQFTIRNMKAGSYRIYALNDVDNDYKYARSEDAAYLDEIIVPTSRPIVTMDTLFTQRKLVDTIVEGHHTLFLPNDIFLSMFNEGYVSQYLKTDERIGDNKIYIKFSGPADTLPEFKILKPEPQRKDWFRMERSEKNDSLVYWLTDSTLIKSDSIMAEITYLRTDTTDNLSATTDTLAFVLKNSFKKQKEKDIKEKAKAEKERVENLKREYEESVKMRQKELERIRKEEEDFRKFNKEVSAEDSARFARSLEMLKDSITLDTVPETPTLSFAITSSGNLDVYAPLKFTSAEPVDSLFQTGFHLSMFNEKDSVWTNIKIDSVKLENVWNPMIYIIEHNWEPAGKYRIIVDSCSVKGIYGLWNPLAQQDFTVKSLEEYSNLFFNIRPVADSAFVELLDGSDKVVQTAPVVKGSAELLNLTPGEYYARIVLDKNGNGVWDTGNFSNHIQPEEVYYYPKVLKLKKNWDVEQTWNIYETPVDKQKPDTVKKNKPEKKKTWDTEEEQKKSTDEEEDEFSPQIYTGNKYSDYNSNN